MSKAKPIRRTVEEKQAILAKVNELKASGQTLTAALEANGINASNYYSWLETTPKTKVVTYSGVTKRKLYTKKAPVTTPANFNVVTGFTSIAQVQEFLRGSNT